ncbi:MAG: nitroreductase [Firmicutes bacterium]|nr:nitroreductase [Bacillota bacterium]
MNHYDMIFKRKSFHIFRETETLNKEEIEGIEQYIQTLTPLQKDIAYTIRLVREEKTSCKRGAEYCILFYSERKEGYLQNIGYIGEQLDLYLTSKSIGTLWFGIGKPDIEIENQEYIIMIAIAKMAENKFRKDMFKAKRKSLEEIWKGEPTNFSNIIRFAPSACNSQPWIVEHKNHELFVYRYKKPGKRGIMPVQKVSYYNRIDIGIFLYFLEICLEHEKISYQRELFADSQEEECVLVAKYQMK